MKRNYLIALGLSIVSYTTCAVVASATPAAGGGAIGVSGTSSGSIGMTGTPSTGTAGASGANAGVSGGAQVGVPNQNFRYQNSGPTGVLGSQPQGITIDETGKSNTTTPPASTQQANPTRIDETGRVTVPSTSPRSAPRYNAITPTPSN